MPMAAGLESENRGKNVGIIFTGVLIGILAARVFSGTIAEWLGWRQVYLLSAIMVAIFTVLLKIFLPDVRTPFKGNYVQLLGSALNQIRRFPLLREVTLIGMLEFGLFSSFWTTLTFHLSGDPFNFQSNIIGLFGLVAIGGALLAPIIGKRSDKGDANRVRLTAAGLMILSILMMMFFQHSVIALIAAVFLLDIGAQAIQVTNVAMIYSLDESSHSRINTIYMTAFFIGGALGTLIGVYCWKFGGWTWVTGEMLISAFLMLWILFQESSKSSKSFKVSK